MKLNDHTTVVEVFALIDFGNYSYLRINKVLTHFRCALAVMPLDEFEQNFRELFHLKPFTNQVQDRPISYLDKENNLQTIFITKELFNKLSSEKSALLQHGYVVLLKKSFMLYSDESETKLQEESLLHADSVKEFTRSLQRSMSIAGYRSFAIKNIFIHIPIIKKKITEGVDYFSVGYSEEDFCEKDNYFINLYLNSEYKLQSFTRIASESFSNAVLIKNDNQRLLQFLLSLEACFSSSRQLVNSPEQLAKYIYIISDSHHVNFSNLNNQLKEVYALKNKLLIDSLSGYDFSEKVNWMEALTRDVLRKMIRFNHIKRERLLLKLEKDFIEQSNKSHRAKKIANPRPQA